jgi:hypothetical protein
MVNSCERVETGLEPLAVLLLRCNMNRSIGFPERLQAIFAAAQQILGSTS